MAAYERKISTINPRRNVRSEVKVLGNQWKTLICNSSYIPCLGKEFFCFFRASHQGARSYCLRRDIRIRIPRCRNRLCNCSHLRHILFVLSAYRRNCRWHEYNCRCHLPYLLHSVHRDSKKYCSCRCTWESTHFSDY